MICNIIVILKRCSRR